MEGSMMVTHRSPSQNLRVCNKGLYLDDSEISSTLQKIWKCIEQEIESELEVYIENEVYILPITIQEHLFSIFLTILLDFMITWGYIAEKQKNSLFKHNDENDLK